MSRMQLKNRYKKFCEDRNTFGVGVAIKLQLSAFFPSPKCRINVILNLFKRLFKEELDYSRKDFKDGEYIKNPIVWSMWWQGENALPDILKISYMSHIRNIKNQGIDYRLVTHDNYREFVDVPEYIIEKLNNGVISFTHFSDLLRILLLEKYGGTWVDITLLTLKPVDKEIFAYPFYSICLENTNHKPTGLGQIITGCKWTGFMLSTNQAHFPLLVFIKKCLLKYWELNNHAIDYFFMNLIIRLGYENVVSFKDTIDRIPTNNPDLYSIQQLLNKNYDDKLLFELKKKTTFFKVTQKVMYDTCAERNDTLYYYLSTIFNNK